MPIARFQMPDGRIARFEVPEGTTADQLSSFASPEQAAKSYGPDFSRLDDPSLMDNALSKVRIPEPIQWLADKARGVAMGAADPVVGAAQLAANHPLMPDSIRQGVNSAIAEKERGYGDRRFDGARLLGGLISPVNVLTAGGPLKQAVTWGERAAQGAGLGAMFGAFQPVTDPKDFWSSKASQVGVGAATGGVLSPILGKLGDMAVKRLSPKLSDDAVRLMASGQEREAVDSVLKDIPDLPNIPQAYMDDLRKQVAEALKQGKSIDAAAVLRKKDFDLQGIPPMLGQITRDPQQFAKELNLRAVPGVGDPLMARITHQNQRLQNDIGSFASGAGEAQAADVALFNALKSTDAKLRGAVSGAYADARAQSGKSADVPLQGLAQDYADILDRFADKVPAGVQNQFRKLGLDPANPGNQRRVFTVEDADKLLKVINDNWSNEPATRTALGELSQKVKGAILDAPADDVFAKARQMAADRFRLQEAIPMLEQASRGAIAPDRFVQSYVINGNPRQVQMTADLLKVTSPEAWQEARAQIGAYLKRAAFGENGAGDKAIAPERFQQALRNLGTERLGAFFSPQEIAEMQRLGRIAAYTGSAPAKAPVLGNPNMVWAADLINRIPYLGKAAGAVKAVGGGASASVMRGRDAAKSLAADVPVQDLPGSTINDPAMTSLANYLRLALTGAAAGFGAPAK